ncbi:MAG: hypothetical protein LBR37_00495 [Erysipelotrichaceae bacterium]|jgi:nitrogen regulatory protein PII|nr:hypothetical protein [Erysipelotrichaceae bacterium]
MKALFIIVNAGFSDEVVKRGRELGAGGATIINARSTGKDFIKAFGISFEEEKEIIISLVEDEVAERIGASFEDEKYKNEHGNGIAFSLPVDSVSLINKIVIDSSAETSLDSSTDPDAKANE